jgi:hypothetical protein
MWRDRKWATIWWAAALGVGAALLLAWPVSVIRPPLHPVVYVGPFKEGLHFRWVLMVVRDGRAEREGGFRTQADCEQEMKEEQSRDRVFTRRECSGPH